MKIELTPTQKSYLEWLNQGNSIQVCLECFTQAGNIEYSAPLPFKADHRALDNLKRYGLLQFKDETEYGIRWTVASISEKGIQLLKEQA